MTERVLQAVVAGSVSLDLVTDDPRARTARAAVGNSGANIAVRMANAGINVQFVCLIGDDDPGRLVVADLERWGVSTDGVVRRPGYRTPLVFQVTAGDGSGAESLSSSCPVCGRPRGHRLELPRTDELSDNVWETIRRSDIVVCDIADELSSMVLASGRGLAWYEASLQEASREAMVSCAEAADVVKVSSDDETFYGPALAAAERAGAYIAITRGSGGVDWRSPSGVITNQPTALRVPPIDTIGAGDAFTAAAVTLCGEEDRLTDVVFTRSLEAGSLAAAEACLSVGARGDMRREGGPWIAGDAFFHCTRCQGRG